MAAGPISYLREFDQYRCLVPSPVLPQSRPLCEGSAWEAWRQEAERLKDESGIFEGRLDSDGHPLESCREEGKLFKQNVRHLILRAPDLSPQMMGRELELWNKTMAGVELEQRTMDRVMSHMFENRNWSKECSKTEQAVRIAHQGRQGIGAVSVIYEGKEPDSLRDAIMGLGVAASMEARLHDPNAANRPTFDELAFFLL